MKFEDLPAVIHILMCPFIESEDLPNLCIASKQFNLNARVLFLPNALKQKVRDPALLGFGGYGEDKEDEGEEEEVFETEEVSIQLNLILQKNTHTVRVSLPLNYGICDRSTKDIDLRIEDSDGNIVAQNISETDSRAPFRSYLDFTPKQEIGYTLSIEFKDTANRCFYMNSLRIEALVYGTDFVELYKAVSNPAIEWDAINRFFLDEKISYQVKKLALQYQFDEEDNTLLHKCCSEQQSSNAPDKIVSTLLGLCERDVVIAKNRSGFTPLHQASRFGHLQAMRSIIEVGGDEALLAKDNVKCTPLHLACMSGHEEAMQVLTDAGGKDIVLSTDILGSTPLHSMIKAGNASITGTNLLTDVGGKDILMAKDTSENTVLAYACRERMVQLMVFIIARGGKDVVLDIVEKFENAERIESFLEDKESLRQPDIDELVPLLIIKEHDSFNDFEY